jgi:hypothetical protein
VTRYAPRLSHRLVTVVDRLDDERLPIAEVARRVGREADRLGLTRPSYERIRQLVHASRELHRGPSAGRVLAEIALQERPIMAIVDLAEGTIRPLRP